MAPLTQITYGTPALCRASAIARDLHADRTTRRMRGDPSARRIPPPSLVASNLTSMSRLRGNCMPWPHSVARWPSSACVETWRTSQPCKGDGREGLNVACLPASLPAALRVPHIEERLHQRVDGQNTRNETDTPASCQVRVLQRRGRQM